MAKYRVCPAISCYIRNCPKAFGTIPSKAYVLGARAHARIADLSIQTLVDSQSDTKYTPRRSSSLLVLVIQCIQSLISWVRPTGLGPLYLIHTKYHRTFHTK